MAITRGADIHNSNEGATEKQIKQQERVGNTTTTNNAWVSCAKHRPEHRIPHTAHSPKHTTHSETHTSHNTHHTIHWTQHTSHHNTQHTTWGVLGTRANTMVKYEGKRYNTAIRGNRKNRKPNSKHGWAIPTTTTMHGGDEENTGQGTTYNIHPTTHNTQHAAHNTQHTTHITHHTTHNTHHNIKHNTSRWAFWENGQINGETRGERYKTSLKGQPQKSRSNNKNGWVIPTTTTIHGGDAENTTQSTTYNIQPTNHNTQHTAHITHHTTHITQHTGHIIHHNTTHNTSRGVFWAKRTKQW